MQKPGEESFKQLRKREWKGGFVRITLNFSDLKI